MDLLADASLVEVLVRLTSDLDAYGRPWALIGGLAVTVRGEPRSTQDIDVVVAVATNAEAEGVGFYLSSARGYRFVDGQFERKDADRMSTIRLIRLGARPDKHVNVDILVASSGIEAEVVAAADRLELIRGVSIPVASRGHLLALKALAGRPKDVTDFFTLRKHATPDDLAAARASVAMIRDRGFARGKDLAAELERLLVEPSYDWG